MLVARHSDGCTWCSPQPLHHQRRSSGTRAVSERWNSDLISGPSASTSRTASLATSSASSAPCFSSGFHALPIRCFASSSSAGSRPVVKIARSSERDRRRRAAEAGDEDELVERLGPHVRPGGERRRGGAGRGVLEPRERRRARIGDTLGHVVARQPERQHPLACKKGVRHLLAPVPVRRGVRRRDQRLGRERDEHAGLGVEHVLGQRGAELVVEPVDLLSADPERAARARRSRA
jgi:hypothetical protein